MKEPIAVPLSAEQRANAVSLIARLLADFADVPSPPQPDRDSA